MKITCSEIGKVVEYLCPQIIEIAQEEKNTHIIVVFLEIGQQINIVGDNLYSTINQAVREAQNTSDNISVKIYTGVVLSDDKDEVKITVFAKSIGAENMSVLEILKLARSAQSRTVVLEGRAKCLI
jgi:tartrate dehydratase alpha subunit/fumarate hydratase class I-like protein